MKGVILNICPQARLVDLSHQVPPQDIRAGALVLEQALPVFGPGTVHLAVVDPGVGTERRPMCAAALGMFFVGPDNGLFTAALEADPQAQAYVLTEERYFRQPVSETFQGRDIFAPVAARIAQGLSPSALGPPLKDPVLLDWPRPRLEGEQLMGQVLGVDGFGNLSTNLIREVVTEFLQGRQASIKVAGLDIPALSRAYGQAEPGQAVAVFNSMDRLELALNQGGLCAKLGLSPSQVFGLEVVLTRQG
jgi:hypothetical protein